MSAPFSAQARVGRRVALTVVWTVVLVVGLAIGLLVGLPDLASLVQMVLSGIWGIAASHRNLRHSVDLIAEIDRARTETIRLDSSRYMQRSK
jgi:hypothetical protein